MDKLSSSKAIQKKDESIPLFSVVIIQTKSQLYAIIKLVMALFFAGIGSASQASQINGSFESDFAGWQTIGTTSIETSAFGIEPTDGTNQALISNSSGAATPTQIENFLGLPTNTLSNVAYGIGGGAVINGSAVKHTFNVSAGDIVIFDYMFFTNDAAASISYNDFAFLTLTLGSFSLIGEPLVLQSANPSIAVQGRPQDNLESSPTRFLLQNAMGFRNDIFLTMPDSGELTIGFGVVNLGDSLLESALLIDNVRVVPLPAALWLFSSGLLGLIGISRKTTIG